MAHTVRFPKPGERVRFNHGGDVLEGICNGEPKGFDPLLPDLITHVPVHVPETNANMMVAAKNITEWPNA